MTSVAGSGRPWQALVVVVVGRLFAAGSGRLLTLRSEDAMYGRSEDAMYEDAMYGRQSIFHCFTIIMVFVQKNTFMDMVSVSKKNIASCES